MAYAPGTNTGHGHVWPRPDGVKARCGGSGLCKECSADLADKIKAHGGVDMKTLVEFSGPTCRDGRFEMKVSGPMTAKVLDNIIRQLEIYKTMLAEDDLQNTPTET